MVMDDEKSLVKQGDEYIGIWTLFHSGYRNPHCCPTDAYRFLNEKPPRCWRIFDYFSITDYSFPSLLPFFPSFLASFLAMNSISAMTHIHTRSIVKKKERNFVHDHLFSVYELLRELGGYLPPKSIAPVDITPLVSRLLRVNGAPLFDFFVDVDLYDRSRSSVFLDLPTKRQEDAFFAENPVSVLLSPLIFSHVQVDLPLASSTSLYLSTRLSSIEK